MLMPGSEIVMLSLKIFQNNKKNNWLWINFSKYTIAPFYKDRKYDILIRIIENKYDKLCIFFSPPNWMSYSSHLLATAEQVSAMRLWLTCSYCALSDSGARSVFNRLAGLAGCKKGGVYRECVRYTFRQLQPTPPTVNMHLVTYYVVTDSKIIITNKTNFKTNRRVEE